MRPIRCRRWMPDGRRSTASAHDSAGGRRGFGASMPGYLRLPLAPGAAMRGCDQPGGRRGPGPPTGGQGLPSRGGAPRRRRAARPGESTSTLDVLDPGDEGLHYLDAGVRQGIAGVLDAVEAVVGLGHALYSLVGAVGAPLVVEADGPGPCSPTTRARLCRPGAPGSGPGPERGRAAGWCGRPCRPGWRRPIRRRRVRRGAGRSTPAGASAGPTGIPASPDPSSRLSFSRRVSGFRHDGTIAGPCAGSSMICEALSSGHRGPLLSAERGVGEPAGRRPGRPRYPSALAIMTGSRSPLHRRTRSRSAPGRSAGDRAASRGVCRAGGVRPSST